MWRKVIGSVVAVVLAAAAVYVLVASFGFDITDADPTFPDREQTNRYECSAPLGQVFGSPSPGIRIERPSNAFIPVRINAQPACEDLGRTRALTGGLLLLVAGAVFALALLPWRFRTRDADDASSEAVASNGEPGSPFMGQG